MHIAFKYKLYPTKEQESWLSKAAGSTRWLWNFMLDLNIKTYDQDKKFVFVFDMKKLIPGLKALHPWLKETPSQSLQQKCFDLDVAMNRAFKKTSRFPKFKSKSKNRDSFYIPQSTNKQIKIFDSHIQIPKLGKIRWKLHRQMEGELKSITISKKLDSWYVSCLCEVSEVEIKSIDKNKAVGIDLGISSFAILSNGVKINSPNFLKKKLKYLKKYQRQLKKKTKGSNNRNKAKYRVAKTHQKIQDQRANWLHQLSCSLTNEYDLICLEDLKTKDLISGKKKQKSLNRAISDQGWGKFIAQIKYKQLRKGHHTTQIGQWAPSSKTCSCCGHKVEKMALDIREWTCPSCGSVLDRDLNAATNILVWGLMMTPAELFETNTEGTSGINACGDTNTHPDQAYDWLHEVSMKQEAACSLEPQ